MSVGRKGGFYLPFRCIDQPYTKMVNNGTINKNHHTELFRSWISVCIDYWNKSRLV